MPKRGSTRRIDEHQRRTKQQQKRDQRAARRAGRQETPAVPTRPERRPK